MSERIRYAVVGLGYIAQSAVLPAFPHVRKQCELPALVSDDARKNREPEPSGAEGLADVRTIEPCGFRR